MRYKLEWANQAAAVAAGPTTPASSVFLCHFDGADNATTYTDSINARTITNNGTAKLDTTKKKFGSASLELNGSSSYATLAAHSDFVFGTGDFYVGLWFYLDSMSHLDSSNTNNALISNRNSTYTNINWCLYLTTTTGQIKLDTDSAGWVNSGSVYATAGAWHHVAFAKTSGTTRLFFNGTKVGSSTTNHNMSTSSGLTIGADQPSTYANAFQGWIDEVVVIKGSSHIGNSDSAFTPYTGAYGEAAVPGRQVKVHATSLAWA
jgi:hypothetical protein